MPGQYFDAETGLHYNRFRYYDPTVGRYISADPIGQEGGINLYAYVRNRPTMMIDPLGLAGRIVCTRCKGGSGAMTCRATDDFGNDVTFTANTQGPNFPAFTGESPGAGVSDPHGPNGPLPAGVEYGVVPRGTPPSGARYPAGTPSATGPGQAPGSLTTPAGTQRSVIFFHGPGRTDGCFACDNDGERLVQDMMLREQNNGGTTVIINEVDCNTCDPNNPPQ